MTLASRVGLSKRILSNRALPPGIKSRFNSFYGPSKTSKKVLNLDLILSLGPPWASLGPPWASLGPSLGPWGPTPPGPPGVPLGPLQEVHLDESVSWESGPSLPWYGARPGGSSLRTFIEQDNRTI